MFIRTCVKVDVWKRRGCTRGVHKFRTGTTLSRCIFARLFPPPVPPTPLLPPTRRSVSHALYLEARRARIPRSYALSHRSAIAKICHARLYIRDGPQDDVSFILRDVWSAVQTRSSGDLHASRRVASRRFSSRNTPPVFLHLI